MMDRDHGDTSTDSRTAGIVLSPRFLLRRFWNQLPFFAWLVVLWMLLWGQFTWLAAGTGVVVAVVVTRVFRLPPADLTGRVNVFWLIVLIVQFLWELVLGALQVAWQAVGPGAPSAAIVKAPLRVDDDLIMTHVAVTTSLVPGTTVVEADRGRRVLYLHAIGVRTDADIERVRSGVLIWELRIVRAVGSRAELETCRRVAAAPDARRGAERPGATG